MSVEDTLRPVRVEATKIIARAIYNHPDSNRIISPTERKRRVAILNLAIASLLELERAGFCVLKLPGEHHG